MLRLSRFAFGLVLVAPVLVPAFAGTGASCAAASGRSHAALVVDTGAHTTTYCVGLDATSVSGIRLIQLASAQYGLSYHLGFGSQAVCQLDGVGPTGGDCFSAYPDYWGYWHGTSSGGWSWAGSGAASASVGDGDVEGWSWGPGDSGDTHAAPPSLRFAEVCDVNTPTPTPAPKPSPSPPSGGGGSGGSTGSGGGGTGSASASPTPSNGGGTHASAHARPTPKVAPTPPADPGSSSPQIIRAVATSGTTPPNGGPPVGAVAVAVAVVALGLGGALTLRRRQRREHA
jgi:hypothetical protein